MKTTINTFLIIIGLISSFLLITTPLGKGPADHFLINATNSVVGASALLILIASALGLIVVEILKKSK